MNQDEIPTEEISGHLLAVNDDNIHNPQYIDDEGRLIPPAGEGSCLMAEGLLEMARAETGQDYVVAEPYVPDFDVKVAALKSKQFLEKEETEIQINDAETPPLSSNATSAANQEMHFVEEDEADMEGVGRFPTMGSRDMTDPDDWKLESILKRRLNKEAEGGLWTYLCKWKGYDEPTWEYREVMEDAGWIPQLDAFDQKGVRAPTTYKGQNKSNFNQEKLESYFGSKEQLIDAVASHIKNSHQKGVMRYCTVNPTLAGPFLDRWKSLRDTHVPKLVFHGTRPQNFVSICRMGLVVGGTKGVRIVNGAAYGNGIYTATNPNLPISYGFESNAIIVCIGLVPIAEKAEDYVYRVGDCIIFRHAQDVFPMWYVQYSGKMVSEIPIKIDTRLFITLSLSGFNAGSGACDDDETRILNEKQKLSEPENRKVNRAIYELTSSVGGGISKSALKAQPRHIRELLARAAVERRTR